MVYITVFNVCIHTRVYIYLHIYHAGIAATEALRKGLEDLRDLCGHVQHKFEVCVYIVLSLSQFT